MDNRQQTYYPKPMAILVSCFRIDLKSFPVSMIHALRQQRNKSTREMTDDIKTFEDELKAMEDGLSRKVSVFVETISNKDDWEPLNAPMVHVRIHCKVPSVKQITFVNFGQ